MQSFFSRDDGDHLGSLRTVVEEWIMASFSNAFLKVALTYNLLTRERFFWSKAIVISEPHFRCSFARKELFCSLQASHALAANRCLLEHLETAGVFSGNLGDLLPFVFHIPACSFKLWELFLQHNCSSVLQEENCLWMWCLGSFYSAMIWTTSELVPL